MDEPPRGDLPRGESPRGALPLVESPAGSSPLRQSPGSFGSSTGNTLRDYPAGGARPGAPESDRGFGSASRVSFGGQKGDDPLRREPANGAISPGGISPSPQGWDSPPRVGLQTPRTPAPIGGIVDPLGRSTAPGQIVGGPGRRSDGTYEVQPNDSFWTISNNLYGTEAYYQALLAYNRSKNPQVDQIRPGDRILAPSADELAQLYPQLCPQPDHRAALAQRAAVREPSVAPPGTRAYVVQPGDTVYDIARSELGSATRWNEILQLNRDQLGTQANYITPGMRLFLPQESGGPGLLTQRPGSGSMR
jgi:nucleoid-associated protein YgaU